jgi:hypothetical protein
MQPVGWIRRFKTEAEFVETFGKEWRSRRYGSYEWVPKMDPLFGSEIMYYKDLRNPVINKSNVTVQGPITGSETIGIHYDMVIEQYSTDMIKSLFKSIGMPKKYATKAISILRKKKQIY